MVTSKSLSVNEEPRGGLESGCVWDGSGLNGRKILPHRTSEYLTQIVISAIRDYPQGCIGIGVFDGSCSELEP